MQETSISPTVDFDQDGIQHGFLKLPHSDDTSAWGSVMIPITIVKNGEGPTALLTGGNHGDEYEGITALLKLANTINTSDIKGRIIIVPAMNFPAVANGSRTSPIDRGNLNRSFPGRSDGPITEKIADYFSRYLVPMCDYALDIHSGGKTLDFLPFAAVHRLNNAAQQQQSIAAMKAFGAPVNMMILEMDATSLYDTIVEAAGKIFVTTELGGGGTTTPETMAIADRGVRNFLIHAGILQAELEPTPTVQFMDMPEENCYVTSEDEGILEMRKNLGEDVSEGETIAFVHAFKKTGVPPVRYTASRSGMLVCRHHPAKIAIGDTLAVIAEKVEAC